MAPSTATLVPVPHVLGAVSTTTIYRDPTGVPAASDSVQHHSGTSSLIGPIVGGAVGGVFLAVIAVVGWHMWGRSIKRKEDEKRRETVSAPDIPAPFFGENYIFCATQYSTCVL